MQVDGLYVSVQVQRAVFRLVEAVQLYGRKLSLQRVERRLQIYLLPVFRPAGLSVQIDELHFVENQRIDIQSGRELYAILLAAQEEVSGGDAVQ